MPPSGSAAMSSDLARAMFSRLPSSSMWLSPTCVTIPHSGRTNEHSDSICRSPRMPISTTTLRVSASAASSVFGTPSSLFWLPRVAVTLPAQESTSRTRFLVVVLPFEPVRPTTRPRKRQRHARARSVMAFCASSTSKIAAPSSCTRATISSGSARVTSTQRAPAETAARTKSCPSTRSPASAT